MGVLFHTKCTSSVSFCVAVALFCGVVFVWYLVAFCFPSSAPPLVFPGEQKIFRAMYAQVGEKEQVISPPYTRTQLDASMRGRKKRKQGDFFSSGAVRA